MTIDTAVWRDHPQLMHLKAAFIKPVTVFARRVNQASFTYPLAQVTYDDPDGGTGVYTSVKEGMTLGVYSSSDVFKGLLRVRKAPTASTLYVNETSAGDVDFADNDKLVVYDDYRLWARVPRMMSDKTFYKDYDLTWASQIGYTGALDKLKPVANTGPHRAKDVDPVTGTVDIAFNGANSFRQAAGIGDALTYVWDFKDGTVVSGSAYLSTATVRFPAGQRWADLTVTDGNSKTGRAVCAVVTRNTSTYPYVPVALQRLSGSVDSGWECAVSVLAADVSDLLPGTLMILYSDQYYDSVADGVNGYPDCEQILFVGWLDSEDLTVEPFQDELILIAKSALGVLQEIPAYTASLERNLTPSKWHHQMFPNWFRGMMYLMQWHSTLPLVCDVERPASFWGDYLFPAADYTAGSLYDQLRTEAERAWARLTEDKTGRLFVRRNPHLMDTTERAALATTVHIQSTDWREAVQIQRPARSRTGWMKGAGFTNNAGDLKLSLAPGDAPGPGANQTEKNGLWIMDQDDLNTRLGHAFAYENNQTPYLQLTLNHQGAGFDPGWQEAVEFTLDAATNRRGLAFAQDKFIPVSFDITHDPETGATTEVLTLEALTDGVPGTTQPVPTDTGGGGTTWLDEDWTPPDIPIDTYEPPQPEAVSGGSGLKNALWAINRKVVSGGTHYYGMVLAGDLSGSPVTWSMVMNGLPLTYGTPTLFCPTIKRMYVDPFDPGAAYLFMHSDTIQLTHGVVYYNADWRNNGTWEALLTWQDVVDNVANISGTSDCFISDALVSFAQAGLCYILVHPGGDNQHCVIRVDDYGDDVQYSPLTMHPDPYRTYFNVEATLAIGHDDPDKVWIDARNVAAHYQFYAVWGSFPLDPYTSQYWYRTSSLTLDNQIAFVLNPYWKLDGTRNLDTQLYLAEGTGADNNIWESDSGVSNLAEWTADAVVPLLGDRDRFDVPGKTNMRAWWRDTATLHVLKTTNPAVITDYSIPAFTEDGFSLHWPFNPGQYYAAQYASYSAISPPPVLKMTLDADSGVWTDLTGNFWAIEAVATGGHAVVTAGFCPHWTET